MKCEGKLYKFFVFFNNNRRRKAKRKVSIIKIGKWGDNPCDELNIFFKGHKEPRHWNQREWKLFLLTSFNSLICPFLEEFSWFFILLFMWVCVCLFVVLLWNCLFCPQTGKWFFFCLFQLDQQLIRFFVFLSQWAERGEDETMRKKEEEKWEKNIRK